MDLIKLVLKCFKGPQKICDLDIIEPSRDLNLENLRIARYSDTLGNYDVDGVSFDGEQICVAGDKL